MDTLYSSKWSPAKKMNTRYSSPNLRRSLFSEYQTSHNQQINDYSNSVTHTSKILPQMRTHTPQIKKTSDFNLNNKFEGKKSNLVISSSRRDSRTKKLSYQQYQQNYNSSNNEQLESDFSSSKLPTLNSKNKKTKLTLFDEINSKMIQRAKKLKEYKDQIN